MEGGEADPLEKVDQRGKRRWLLVEMEKVGKKRYKK